MSGLVKCKRGVCNFEINPNRKNNDGSHCCYRCMKNGKHGPLCKGVVVVAATPAAATSGGQ
jgi:hypothetical protein